MSKNSHLAISKSHSQSNPRTISDKDFKMTFGVKKLSSKLPRNESQ